jgi:hypothetical protein
VGRFDVALTFHVLMASERASWMGLIRQSDKRRSTNRHGQVALILDSRVSGMAPGPELNEKIAVELLGLTVEQYRQKSLDYSAYLVPAFQHVVGSMIGRGYVLRVRPATGTRNMVVEFGLPGTTTPKPVQGGQLVGSVFIVPPCFGATVTRYWLPPRGSENRAMAYHPRPRWFQALGGLLIAAGSAAATAYGWHTGYTGKGTALFPFFFVMGLGLVLFPGYKEERLARGEDISKLSGVDLITPRWWAVLVVGLAAGIANFMLSRE